MRITVIGSGYVGLVVGACLANVGNDVVCADVDAQKVARLERGEVPFFEPGLEPIVQSNHKAGRLRFTTDVEAACRQGAVIFIAVGTPQGDDGSAEMRYVEQVATTIGHALAAGENMLVDGIKIVLTKSTVPVGTADRVSALIGEHAKQRYVVCSNPEFLKEGDAVNDFLKPDRIVIGTPDTAEGEAAREVLHELYEPFTRTRDRVQFMDVRSSELTKYAANALLATKISFMNELANLAERVGADVEKVRTGIGADPRIGYHFLFPGTGYGGSCFPKDVKALTHTGREHGHPLRILDAVDAVNRAQKTILLRKAIAHFGGEEALRGKKIAVWGLAFKPRTDDMREAPSLDLVRGLLAAGATVAAHDPEAMPSARALLGDGPALLDDHYACLDGADALCICTEWSLFRRPDFDEVKRRMAAPVIFDGRNLYDPERIAARGFTYYAIGRGRPLPV
ncbi:MAG: UDP-glucose/GDP-mannose dehydrogenase family protein [Myxococcales bacterium]|nr:UDP-glucose/GDP-mannose dehydrogenase family protein [Myxococcales bacterium]MCB9554340.1 UDP-glucose/GDP-mannose dehydrogenase family protein [Myxococcales bacterium]